MKTIKSELLDKLRGKKQEEKAAKEAKQVASRLKLTNEITAQGGVWCTVAIINTKCEEFFENRTD